MSSIDLLIVTAMCLHPETEIETKTGLKKIKDLIRGDLILTKTGYQPLTKNVKMKSTTEKYKYIKIPKERFGTVPNQDLLISPQHPFSLGFEDFQVKDGIFSNPGRSIGLLAKELKENVWGVEEIELEEPYYNLIFDEEEEFSANGMKILSHHPNSTCYQLPKTDFYQYENKADVNHLDIKWSEFTETKFGRETIEEFVERKLSYYSFNWINYINNYDDLKKAISNEKEAVEHWLKCGKEENRTSLTRVELRNFRK